MIDQVMGVLNLKHFTVDIVNTSNNLYLVEGLAISSHKPYMKLHLLENFSMMCDLLG